MLVPDEKIYSIIIISLLLQTSFLKLPVAERCALFHHVLEVRCSIEISERFAHKTTNCIETTTAEEKHTQKSIDNRSSRFP